MSTLLHIRTLSMGRLSVRWGKRWVRICTSILTPFVNFFNEDITNQDVCVFYEDHALYPNFGGVVVEDEESANIVKYLGTKKALILQNHGILTVGQTIEECVAWYIRLEDKRWNLYLLQMLTAQSGLRTLVTPNSWQTQLPRVQILLQ